MDAHDKAIIHSSNESDYWTPRDCVKALDQEFHFSWDLAATEENCVIRVVHGSGGAPMELGYFGPDSHWGENALAMAWHQFPRPQFLNPPFSKTLVNAFNTGRIKIDGEWVGHEKDPEKAKTYDIANWARKCWEESQKGATVVGVFPFAPQTDWYRNYVMGHDPFQGKAADVPKFHAAREERRLPHRISFLKPDGTPTGNAGVNSVILVWKPNCGIVGPWQPHQFYWSYR